MKTTHKMKEYRAGVQPTQLIPESKASIVEYSTKEAFANAYTIMQFKE